MFILKNIIVSVKNLLESTAVVKEYKKVAPYYEKPYDSRVLGISEVDHTEYTTSIHINLNCLKRRCVLLKGLKKKSSLVMELLHDN